MLCLESVSLRYPRFALREATFSVSAEDYFVLFGPTGSGKTLILELIAGLRKPDSGSIRIRGRDVTRVDPARRRVGYVPQDLALIPFLSVRRNIAFGLRSPVFRPAPLDGSVPAAIRARVAEVMDLLGIAPLADRMPETLSGGERQRVALGRALAIRPDVLLLDEPLSAVDEGTGDALMRELKALQRSLRVPTVHICHRFAEMAFLATRLARIRDGVIREIGTPAGLFPGEAGTPCADLPGGGPGRAGTGGGRGPG